MVSYSTVSLPTVTTMHKTALYGLHVELGAKMVPFADYQMPLQYSKGIIHEHLHCRNQASLFDISHMGQCLLKGSSAAVGLEKLTPAIISRLGSGRQQYTVLTNSDGGIIDDIVVTRLGQELTIVVNAACKEKDFKHLRKQLINDCQLQELTEHTLLALQGPSASHVLQQIAPEACRLQFMQACRTEIDDIPCMISRSGYTGEDGFEISLPNRFAEKLARMLLNFPEVEPAGLGARDTLRLEAGLSLYSHELDEKTTPIEAGLSWLIKNTHQSYPGAGTLLNQMQNGTEIQRVGLLVEAKMPVRENAQVFDSEDKLIGRVTSGSFSPSLGRPIALALINTEAAVIGATLFTRVRNNLIKLTVCDLPFVPHRYHRS
ncbi:glycine cleavage complex protein T, aminomethyltransferase, tetrahydrofolate-dependent [Methylotuvimicrobium alcaliphilum 20Z]|uniref:aminomethyltransferase n=2 Tax=Methylotuvimicrobium alcaliphilum TaxID=271065 RepID=G4T403_META2|nr:glycine cleavage complex protein T, aminomethyltransferase, tetrahydrofolate-dependent [Methylotuvimicrobium alcaliphilum 20Z]